VLALWAVTAFLTRKRIAWEACLDMPVGLTLRQEPGTSTEITCEIFLGEAPLHDPGPRAATAQDGWLSYSASPTQGS